MLVLVLVLVLVCSEDENKLVAFEGSSNVEQN
jgi:hypothetical protein